MPDRPTRDCRCARARHQHGTVQAYRADHCRCGPCCAAFSRAQKVKRHRSHRHVPAFATPVGVARRLQALAAVGWSAEDLAPMLGTSATNVIRWRRGNPERVLTMSVARVAAVYDQVWDQPPPGRYAAKVRNLAAKAGWPPPMAWDNDTIDEPKSEALLHNTTVMSAGRKMNNTPAFIDEIAVAEAIHGRRVALTKAEMTEAVRRLTVMGHSVSEIADILGTYDRKVARARAAA